MYSCGSLAPKMKKGGCGGGCSASSTYSRPAEPWEVCDGAVMLFAEICKVVNVDAQEENKDKQASLRPNQRRMAPLPIHPLEQLFESLLQTTRITNYEQHSVLQETVCQKI